MPRQLREGSVARQVLTLQVVVLLVVVTSALVLATLDARRSTRSAARTQAVAVARTVADAESVRAGVASADPTAVLQPYALRVDRDAGVDFVTIMNLQRIRWTHPDPAQIGRRFVGDVGGAPQGRVFTQNYTGTLGPSVRAVVPVREVGGTRVVALVAVGIRLTRTDAALRRALPGIALAALGTLAVGMLGTVMIGRRLRRQTHGLGAGEITRMYEYYTAVLHAVREGLLLLDPEGRVQLANDEARRLLGLPDDVAGRSLAELGLPRGLVETASGGEADQDRVYVHREQALVVSSSPATWGGRDVGSVVTLRDRTELRDVTGELDVVRGLTESLRAQNHEAANRLHTVVSLVEMGRPDDAVAFAVEELRAAQDLTDMVVGSVRDPVLVALLLGKTAEAAERGVELSITGDVPESGLGLPARDLVTVVGNLLDNAFDAVTECDPPRRVALDVGVDADLVEVVVGDSGPGVAPERVEQVLARGWSTKDDGGGRGIGLALVSQVARRSGGDVEVGRSVLGGAEFRVTLRTAVVDSR